MVWLLGETAVAVGRSIAHTAESIVAICLFAMGDGGEKGTGRDGYVASLRYWIRNWKRWHGRPLNMQTNLLHSFCVCVCVCCFECLQEYSPRQNGIVWCVSFVNICTSVIELGAPVWACVCVWVCANSLDSVRPAQLHIRSNQWTPEWAWYYQQTVRHNYVNQSGKHRNHKLSVDDKSNGQPASKTPSGQRHFKSSARQSCWDWGTAPSGRPPARTQFATTTSFPCPHEFLSMHSGIWTPVHDTSETRRSVRRTRTGWRPHWRRSTCPACSSPAADRCWSCSSCNLLGGGEGTELCKKKRSCCIQMALMTHMEGYQSNLVRTRTYTQREWHLTWVSLTIIRKKFTTTNKMQLI